MAYGMLGANALIENVNILAFNISKSYFMYFNIPLYNIPNIKNFIFFNISLKYYFFIIFLIIFYFQFISSSLFLSFSMYLSSLKPTTKPTPFYCPHPLLPATTAHSHNPHRP